MDPVDPRWPKLLSLSVHEFRTPMTVVAGYIRMLLNDRAGPLTDPQRRLLQEAEKSCGRLSALLTEVSDLSNLEAGTAPFNRQAADLRAILGEAIAALPELPDREVHVELQAGDECAPILADATRLRQALTSVIAALRRELVTSDRLLVRVSRARVNEEPFFDIRIGDQDTLDAIEKFTGDDLPVFDEWRGGCGLSLAVARRIIDAQGGRLRSAPDGGRAGAQLMIASNAPS